MKTRIILDLSRLLSRVFHGTPTGVDRVEMAYARQLWASAYERVEFAAVHPAGAYGRLQNKAVLAFLDRTERGWEQQGRSDHRAVRRNAAESLFALRPRRLPAARSGRCVYVQSSPHHLTRPRVVENILRQERARLVCLVHDLIPLEFPEYARPAGAALHRIRVDTILSHAAGIIANSASTLASLQPYLNASVARPIVRVAHLGVSHATTQGTATRRPEPYFVMIGTIEPRKNHLLLLNVWRRISEQSVRAPVPKLILVGRRGWENEQVVDMLERCPALKGCVEELGGLSDDGVRNLLRGARALLLPSFAEGYGMPVAEALEMGTPVICSDLPALREAGGDGPDYLDPLDGPAWQRAIVEYTHAGSPRRAYQVSRITTWQSASWRDHIKIVLEVAEEVWR